MRHDPATLPSAPPLRVVLLVDSFLFPRWAAQSVRDMLQSAEICITGIVVNGSAEQWSSPAPKRSLRLRIANAWRKRGAVLLDRYLRLDAARYPARGSDPFETIDLTDILSSLPRITVSPRQTRFSDFFDDDALSSMRSMEPDVAVRLGFRILRGLILSVPTYGVWSFHHDDNQVLRGGPPGLWEVLLGWPATGALLQRLSEDLDGGTTLARTWTATNPISVNQNRIALYRAAAPMLVRKLKEVHRRGGAALKLQHSGSSFQPYAGRLYVAPTVRELVAGLVRVLQRLVRRKIQQIRIREQWQLLYGFDPRQSTDNRVPQSSAFRLKPLVPPADRFWADPFTVEHEGRQYVFFEELIFTENKGRICMIELTATGPVGAPRVVLERDHHLSYPNVFEYGGQWYMLPEMASHGVQEVFRATTFPDTWELHSVLPFDRGVVDPTLHFDGERWWLFVGTAACPDSDCDELSLFYSASPLGPWVPHVANPVVSDARGARPAGCIFRVGDDLIRPAQDGTPSYGSAIVFKRILQLDTEAYREESIARIDPKWAPDLAGTHTINAAGRLTVMDTRVITRT